MNRTHRPITTRDLILGRERLAPTDRVLIQDAWERQDAAADRGEDCTGRSWPSDYGNASNDHCWVRVDPAGDLWVDGLLIAYRDQDVLVVCGSMERVLVY